MAQPRCRPARPRWTPPNPAALSIQTLVDRGIRRDDAMLVVTGNPGRLKGAAPPLARRAITALRRGGQQKQIKNRLLPLCYPTGHNST